MAVTTYDEQKLTADELKQLRALTEGYEGALGNQALQNTFMQGATGLRQTASGGGYLTDSMGTYNGVTAADKKFYLGGGSGKEFIYNPFNGNIGVNSGGAIRYISLGDSDYEQVFSAMEADTGQRLRSYPADSGSGQSFSGSYLDEAASGGIDALRGQEQAAQGELIDQLNKYLEGINVQRAQALARQSAANRELYSKHAMAADPYGNLGERLALMGLYSSGYADNEKRQILDNYNALINKNKVSTAELLSELDRAKKAAVLQGDEKKAQLSDKYYRLVMEEMLATALRQTTVEEQAAAGGQAENKSAAKEQASSPAAKNNTVTQVVSVKPESKTASAVVQNNVPEPIVPMEGTAGEEQKTVPVEIPIYYSAAAALELLSAGRTDPVLISTVEKYYHLPYMVLKSFPPLLLPSGYSLADQDSLPFKISNNTGDDWMYISMMGRITFADLLNKLASGDIKYIEQNGTYSFIREFNKK